jgi:hypothetical protein
MLVVSEKLTEDVPVCIFLSYSVIISFDGIVFGRVILHMLHMLQVLQILIGLNVDPRESGFGSATRQEMGKLRLTKW